MDTDCPACEYKAQMFNKKNIILCNQLCLFEWPDFSCVFEGPYCNGVGLFNRWTQANYPEERSGLALQIANLPVRKLLRKEK